MRFNVHHVHGNVFCILNDRDGNPFALRVIPVDKDDVRCFPYRLLESVSQAIDIQHDDRLYMYPFTIPYSPGMTASFIKRAVESLGNGWRTLETHDDEW